MSAEVELAVESLAHDLHVQEPQEPAAKAEAQRFGGLGLVGDGGVVELQFVERVAQVRQVVAVDGVDPAEDHRLGVEVALERPCAGRAASVIVSPERAPPTSLMPATM